MARLEASGSDLCASSLASRNARESRVPAETATLDSAHTRPSLVALFQSPLFNVIYVVGLDPSGAGTGERGERPDVAPTEGRCLVCARAEPWRRV